MDVALRLVELHNLQLRWKSLEKDARMKNDLLSDFADQECCE